MKYLIRILLIWTIFYPVSLIGQDTTIVSSQLWTLISLKKNLGIFQGDLTLEYDQELSGEKEYYSFYLEPSITYSPDNSFDFTGELYVDYTQQAKDTTTTEIRPTLSAVWIILKPEHRSFLRLKAKMEYQYFINHNSSSTNSVRIRPSIENRISLNRNNYNQIKNFYQIIKFEYFYHFTEQISQRFWNEYRVYLGLGYKFNNRYRLDVQYIYQSSRNNTTETRPSSVENILEVTMTRFFKTKPKKEQ